MKACVIGSKVHSQSTMEIYEAMKNSKRFSSVFFVPTEGIKLGVKNGEHIISYRDKDLADFDVVIPRIGAPKAFFGYLIVKYIWEAGVYVPITPESTIIAHHKYLTIDVLSRANIPVPETYLSISPSAAKRAVEDLKPPVVMKLIGGSGGKGVMFAGDRDTLKTLIDTLDVLDQSLFIEKYIKNLGEDIRLLVVGDEVVACMKRIAQKGEKRANISAGGKGVVHRPTSEMADVALRSAKAVGAEICGIDVIEGLKGKPYVIEANLAPGMKIAKVTGVDVPKKIVNYVADRAEERKPLKMTEQIDKTVARLLRSIKDTLKI